MQTEKEEEGHWDSGTMKHGVQTERDSHPVAVADTTR